MPHNPEKKSHAVKQKEKSGPRAVQLREALDSIKVTLLHAPGMPELDAWMPGWTSLTWSDVPGQSDTCTAMSESSDSGDGDECSMSVEYALSGKVLPSALETINLVFLIEGISQIDSVHILRHRTFSFSGQSTDARDCRDDALCIPPDMHYQIAQNTPLGQRLAAHFQQALDLYIEMEETDVVMREHSRYVLPRASMTALYCRANLKDTIGFIKTRLDRSTQPMSDNIFAAALLLELAKEYPPLVSSFASKDGVVDLDPVHPLFLSSVQTPVAHALHPPEGNADCFEWSFDDFVKNKKKSEYEGVKGYFEKMSSFTSKLQAIYDDWNRVDTDKEEQ